jgi:hypothetical protein
MDSAIKATDIRHHAAVAAPVTPEDDLAFFQALWFWIPVALLTWSAIIWTVLRLV